MPAARSRGPRGAGTDTRADILAAAADVFTQLGYERASMRAIARAAEVDPALVRHYFASKSELFLAALRPIPPGDDRIAGLGAGPIDRAGERLVRTFVALWDDPEMGPRLRTILVSAATTPEVAHAMRGLLVGEVLVRITDATGAPDADERAAACASQLIGLALARYVLGFEPLASASPERLAELYAPTLQRYLTGDL